MFLKIFLYVKVRMSEGFQIFLYLKKLIINSFIHGIVFIGTIAF